jgi:sugar lactone lactonase YvrE
MTVSLPTYFEPERPKLGRTRRGAVGGLAAVGMMTALTVAVTGGATSRTPPPRARATVPGIVHLLAGQPGVANSSGTCPHGLATGADLNLPSGIAVFGGNVYIADSGDNCVVEVTGNGVIVPIAGTGRAGYNGDNIPATTAELYEPSGLAFDSTGDLFIADTQNERIREVRTDGTIVTVAGNGSYGFSGDGGSARSAQLNYPLDVAVSSSGGLYIADTQNERIRFVGSAGTISTIAGSENTPDYGGDEGSAVDSALATPGSVGIAPGGNLYIGDVTNNRVRYIDGAGIIHTAAGDSEPGGYNSRNVATETPLYNPYSVALDGAGNLYIADSTNCLVREVDTSGTISTLVGIPGRCGWGPGDNQPGTSSWLNRPYAIAVGSSGIVYIADTHNDVVRKYVP